MENNWVLTKSPHVPMDDTSCTASISIAQSSQSPSGGAMKQMWLSRLLPLALRPIAPDIPIEKKSSNMASASRDKGAPSQPRHRSQRAVEGGKAGAAALC